MNPPVRGAERSDEELVAAATSGDRTALDQLLRRHHDRIVAVCRQLCRDRSDAEDAAQESLIAIVRGLDRFDGRSRFSTWAYRVTTNCCLDELRRRRRRPEPVDADGRPEPISTGPDPADEAARTDRRATIGAAVAQLPEEFRAPLVLRDVADLDYASIAEILDIPPGTVRSRIARARDRLARTLGNLDGPADVGASGDRSSDRTTDDSHSSHIHTDDDTTTNAGDR